MRAEQRQKRIEEYLQKAEFASLEELARGLGASVSTIRRDLTVLEAGGSFRRTHGGARLVNPRSDEYVFSARDTHQLDEKEGIGALCAGLIQARQTVIIDAGTTAYHVARHLGDQPLQIVTNSLPVANLFTSSQRVEVVVSGGVIYPRLGVLVGPLAVEAFSRAHADVAIMSGGGITLDGITNSHALLIEIQRAMIRGAGRVIFCLDHTKFGRQSVARLCGLDEIDVIVTDSAAPLDLIQALRTGGIEVHIAPTTALAGASQLSQSVLPQAKADLTAITPRPRRRVDPTSAMAQPKTAPKPAPTASRSRKPFQEPRAAEVRRSGEAEADGQPLEHPIPERSLVVPTSDSDSSSNVSWD
jgi:DeoR/GlpR family transcriptional regulator of sugar metabolism